MHHFYRQCDNIRDKRREKVSSFCFRTFFSICHGFDQGIEYLFSPFRLVLYQHLGIRHGTTWTFHDKIILAKISVLRDQRFLCFLRWCPEHVFYFPPLSNTGCYSPPCVSPCSLANIPLTPETARDQERRIRREIANSNERRRMQSINAGFQSLKTLIPHSDGEKLSKVGHKQRGSLN